MRTSTNPTSPEVNDHVNLQWPSSYEQPQDSNLRPQREQTSWSQALTTGHHLDSYLMSFLLGSLHCFDLQMVLLIYFACVRVGGLEKILCSSVNF